MKVLHRCSLLQNVSEFHQSFQWNFALFVFVQNYEVCPTETDLTRMFCLFLLRYEGVATVDPSLASSATIGASRGGKGVFALGFWIGDQRAGLLWERCDNHVLPLICIADIETREGGQRSISNHCTFRAARRTHCHERSSYVEEFYNECIHFDLENDWANYHIHGHWTLWERTKFWRKSKIQIRKRPSKWLIVIVWKCTPSLEKNIKSLIVSKLRMITQRYKLKSINCRFLCRYLFIYFIYLFF